MSQRASLPARLVMSALFSSLGASAQAATFCADSTGAGGCETTIQAAVDLAGPGDEVTVAAGRYDENVVVPAGKDGLTIRAAKAVLDADLPNTGDGLTIGSSNVTVEGLIVQNGRGNGITVSGASGVRLFKVTVRASTLSCIRLVDGDGHVVKKATIEGCRNRGISAGDVDSFPPAVHTNGVTVLKSKFSRNLSTDVKIVGDDARVEKSRFTLTDGDGISIVGDDARALKNKFRTTGGDAVDLDGSNFLAIDNTGDVLHRRMVHVTCIANPPCTGGIISGNEVSVCTSDTAIEVDDTSGGLVIEGNEGTRCDDGGIDVRGDGATIRDNRIRQCGSDAPCYEIFGNNHVVENNEARECFGGGFVVGGDGTTLTGNVATDTLEDGFDVEAGNGTTLVGNTATGNLGVGFAVSQGVTGASVSGNTGSGNREDFCDAGTATSVGANAFATTFDPMGGDCPVDR